jgi:hypothetical protein
MRGVIIENGLELRLEVPGEGFVQGDSVPCTLTVKNHSSSPTSLANLTLTLAQGTLKLVKAKDSKAFQEVALASLNAPEEIQASSTAQFQYTFQLSENCLVSEKNQSLFLIYGSQPGGNSAGQLPLSVTPHTYIVEVFRTLEMVYSFVPKGITWKEGYTIMKFTPPNNRDLMLVEELNLGVIRDGENLRTRYSFKVKKFDTGGSGVAVKKGKTEFEYSLTPNDYLFGGGFINQESLEASINAALKEVSTGLS